MGRPAIPHPFKWYVPKHAKTLIIGTFPPLESRWAYPFFYPNPRNLFWKIMADIADTRISPNDSAIPERKRILNQLRVGVTDMGGIIRRLADNSLDENLELVEHMPVSQILDEYPSLKRIILTSSSGKVSALAWFRLYLLKKEVTHVIPKGSKPLKFDIIYNDRTIEVSVLFSPSPRAANRISYDKLLDMYRGVIMSD